MREITDEQYDDMWAEARQVVSIAHNYYGVELTIQEVLTSVFRDEGCDPDMALGALYVLQQDRQMMKAFLERMEVKPVKTRYREQWAMWLSFVLWALVGLVFVLLLKAIAVGGILGISAFAAFVLGCIIVGMLFGEWVHHAITGRRDID